MDDAARAALRATADQPFPLIYKLECPTPGCGTRHVGPGCLCLGNERTCLYGHHMVRCQTKHEGLLVAIPPSRRPNQHCFKSWGIKTARWPSIKRDDGVHYTDTNAVLHDPCECEAAPLAWAAYKNAQEPVEEERGRDRFETWVAAHPRVVQLLLVGLFIGCAYVVFFM